MDGTSEVDVVVIEGSSEEQGRTGVTPFCSGNVTCAGPSAAAILYVETVISRRRLSRVGFMYL
jgi:hypothetical protein